MNGIERGRSFNGRSGNKIIEGASIELDGKNLDNTSFYQCALSYGGGALPSLQSCDFISSSFTFTEHADRALKFFANVAWANHDPVEFALSVLGLSSLNLRFVGNRICPPPEHIADDLREIYNRLEFSEELITEAQTEIQGFLTYGIERDLRYNGTSGIGFVRLTHEMPIAIPSRVGVAANEIRSILDALACQLVARNGKDPNQPWIHFPIAEDSDKFEAKFTARRGNLHGMFRPEDEKRIRDLQPVADGHPSLFQLHYADIIRKHRRSLAIVGRGSLSAQGPGYIGLMINNPEPIRLEVGEWVNVGLIENSDIATGISFELLYDEAGVLHQQEVFRTLTDFLRSAREVVDMFNHGFTS